MTSSDANPHAGTKKAQHLQAVLDQSIDRHETPFLVGMLVNASGLTFSGAAGHAAAGQPAGIDTVFRIFSMTKAIGSAAAMILIDRGLLSMDDEVERILPAFAGVKVLHGYDSLGKPILRAPRRKATVRHLATHSSGLAYEVWQEEQSRFLQVTGGTGALGSTNLQATLLSDYPMLTEPGTRWAYGVSIDWLGLVVEAVSGQPIMDFLKANLLDPLGMTDTEAVLRDDMARRLAAVHLRGPDGLFGPVQVEPPATTDTFGMGHALYSTPRDYAKFLRMVLGKGESGGHRVLSEGAVARMLANQLPGGLRFQAMTPASPLSARFDPFPDVAKTHGFGFMRVESDVPGMRRAGSVAWAGVCNSHYWIDPASGMAGLVMTQSLPFAEAPFMASFEAFERAAYA